MSWIEGISPIFFPGMGFVIDPPQGIAFGNLTIQFYGVIIALGLLLAAIYGLKRSRQFGLKEDDILDGVLGIVPFAIICARLYYCIFSWDYYGANPIKILYIWEGGLAIYGGVIGAFLGILVFAKIKKVKLGAVLDIVALGFLLGQAIGRWGNFFNREAFGAQTESFLRMGLMLTEKQQLTAGVYYYHPTFFYESIWNLAGFILLHFLSKKRKYDGQIALGYLAWYGLGRTFIEGLRTDSLYILKSVLGETLRVSQLLAAISCFAAVAALLILNFFPHHEKNLFVNIAGTNNDDDIEEYEEYDEDEEYEDYDEEEEQSEEAVETEETTEETETEQAAEETEATPEGEE